MAQRRRSGPPPFKRWCFTLNNPSHEEIDRLKRLPVDLFDYFVASHEEGEENHTPHIQGFANFTTKRTFLQVKRILGERCHIEKARGTDEQNREYCYKQNQPFIEFGTPRRQGQRTDLSHAVSTALSSGDLREVAAQHPETFVRYYRGLDTLIKTMNKVPRREWKTSVYVHWGPPGCGKSRWASCFADPEVTYWKAPRNKWWDGYSGHEVVVLDDFYGWLPYDELLRICDRYPLNLEVKGGTVPFLARTLIITSNKAPQEWYSSDAVPNAEALFRRITFLAVWKTPTGPSTTTSTETPGLAMRSLTDSVTSTPSLNPAPLDMSQMFEVLNPPCPEFPYKINY
uniref:Replication-associated protein n=1 Tax=Tasmanian devil-associated circovirus 1 TaxID=2529490 RepID=A0A481W7G8_9CIRC|nr:replicase [Tasmanian devil-associated circovirus 1]